MIHGREKARDVDYLNSEAGLDRDGRLTAGRGRGDRKIWARTGGGSDGGDGRERYRGVL